MESVSLIDFFYRGGSLMWVLLLCSIIGAAVILERGIYYLRLGNNRDAWMERIRRLVAENKKEEALQEARKDSHPVAAIVRTYLENLGRPAALQLELVKREGALQLERVEARLRVLAAVAHLAPLIGLLGTVLGMVVAFAQIQSLQGAVKPSDLAGGIWEALITTVFGLLVAIPCMAAFHSFESKADKISRRMQFAVTALDDALNLAHGASDQPSIGDLESGVQKDEAEWNTVS